MTVLSLTKPSAISALSEQELRREIDRALMRATFDSEYARHLLEDPTVILGDRGSTPQQYLHLRSIRATNVHDFARQAYDLFWPRVYRRRDGATEEKLAAAAF